MAVQQNKKSKSRKGMRRSHDRVAIPNVVYCSCGEPRLQHSVCPSCGAYRNRQIVTVKPADEPE
jgi:large subunit ribosomal protein L32